MKIATQICFIFLVGTPSIQSDDMARLFVKKWAESFNRNDADEQLKMYDTSKELEVIVSAGIRYSGYKEYASTTQQQFDAVKFYDSFAKKITVREINGSFIMNFEHELKFTANSDDSKWKVHIRTAMVLHKINGKLRIVYEHSSPISGVERLTKID